MCQLIPGCCGKVAKRKRWFRRVHIRPHCRVHPSLQPEEALPDIAVEKLPSDSIRLEIPTIHKVNPGTDEKFPPDMVLEDLPRGRADEVPSIPTVDAGADEKYPSKGLIEQEVVQKCQLLVTQ